MTHLLDLYSSVDRDHFLSQCDIPEDPTQCWLWCSSLDAYGYGRYRVSSKWVKAHRLGFWLAYGHLDSKAFVCHRCGVRRCVNPSHLYEGNAKTNTDDKEAHGNTLRGESVVGSKLTSGDVMTIRRTHASGSKTLLQLSEEWGMHPGYLYLVITGKRWGHLPVYEQSFPATFACENNPNARLCWEDVRAIRAGNDKDRGYIKAMSEKYGITTVQVRKILRGLAWKE